MRHVLLDRVHVTATNPEVIGLDVGHAETEAFWRAFLRSLVERGLAGVELCVSEAPESLKAATPSAGVT